MSKSSQLVDISGQVVHETVKAWFFFDGLRTVWIPKSQGEVYHEGKVTTLTIPEWLAKEKELI